MHSRGARARAQTGFGINYRKVSYILPKTQQNPPLAGASRYPGFH